MEDTSIFKEIVGQIICEQKIYKDNANDNNNYKS